MTTIPYKYTTKDVDSWQSPESPMETNISVGGYPFNSLVEGHPYKEAFSRFGIPAGLVINKGGRSDYGCTLTQELMRGGGATVPEIISDDLYDKLFHKVSGSSSRENKRKTRKVGK